MAGTPPYLKPLDQKDPEFCKLVLAVTGVVDAPGALDAKTKVLMSLLGDAILNHGEGVAALAGRARQLGATEQEIAETVRMAFMAGGLPALITALNAFRPPA
jgi:alkylhydroperoxidase/carboxymuconolactone decarboxylase family protein YurZ